MVDFVLLPGRLISVFVEDVAGYIEKKQEARCRQQCGKRLKSQLKLTVDSRTLFGGLMIVLGLSGIFIARRSAVSGLWLSVSPAAELGHCLT